MPETARLRRSVCVDEEEDDAARASPSGELRGGAMKAPSGADRAALSEGQIEGLLPADAAEDDAAGLHSPERVCTVLLEDRGGAS